MVSPVLDEGQLVGTLAAPCDIKTAAYTRTASMLAIVNARDRKVTREFFAEVAVQSVTLNETMRRAECLANVLVDMDANVLTRERVVACIDQLVAKADGIRQVLYAHMTQVAQCAMDGDSFH